MLLASAHISFFEGGATRFFSGDKNNNFSQNFEKILNNCGLLFHDGKEYRKSKILAIASVTDTLTILTSLRVGSNKWVIFLVVLQQCSNNNKRKIRST